MISSIDPTNAGAALLARNEPTIMTTSQSSFTQGVPLPLLPMSPTNTQSSFNDTINTMIGMLQNLMTSLSSMFGGAAGNGNGTAVGGTPTDRFDFIRSVDEEPPLVIPPRRTTTGGAGATDLGSIPFDRQIPTDIDGEQTPNKTTTDRGDIGTALKKSGGEFLWKPESDKDGKLAILLPKNLTGKVKRVRVMSADGTKELGRGKFSGVGNGDREHYRFSKAGGKFPDGAVVVITMEDGSKHHVKIKETSNRTTR